MLGPAGCPQTTWTRQQRRSGHLQRQDRCEAPNGWQQQQGGVSDERHTDGVWWLRRTDNGVRKMWGRWPHVTRISRPNNKRQMQSEGSAWHSTFFAPSPLQHKHTPATCSRCSSRPPAAASPSSSPVCACDNSSQHTEYSFKPQGIVMIVAALHAHAVTNTRGTRACASVHVSGAKAGIA